MRQGTERRRRNRREEDGGEEEGEEENEQIRIPFPICFFVLLRRETYRRRLARGGGSGGRALRLASLSWCRSFSALRRKGDARECRILKSFFFKSKKQKAKKNAGGRISGLG